MLEMLRRTTTAKDTDKADRLALMVQRAAEERTALQGILDVLSLRGARLTPSGWQIDEADGRANALFERLDDLTARLGALEGQARTLDQIDARIQTLNELTARAEQQALDAAGPDGEVTRHRLALERASVETKQLQSLSLTAEQRLRDLNTLSEQTTQRIKTLEHQHQMVERAVVQSNRVSEMVWTIDAQLNTVSDGLQKVARAEDTITRTAALAGETKGQLDEIAAARQQAELDLAAFKAHAQELLASVADQIAGLDVRRAEFDTFDVRAQQLQDAMARAESRVAAVSEQDKQVANVARQVEGVNRRFELLGSQADELSRKQVALEGMRDQIAHVNGLARLASGQMDALRQGQRDLDTLRQSLQDLTVSNASLAKLRSELQDERAALEAFDQQMSSMSERTSALNAKMDVVLRQVPLIDEGVAKVAELGRQVAVIDGQFDAVQRRVPMLEDVESRLDRLDTLNAGLEARLTEQMARQTEIETLKAACDEVSERTTEAQHRLEAVRAAQSRLLQLITDVDRLSHDIETARIRIDSVTRDEAAVMEQERRFGELADVSRGVAGEVAQRVEDMRRLSGDLQKVSAIRNELCAQLDSVQARQRDAINQVQLTESQLARAEEMLARVEQRSVQAAVSDATLAAMESRCQSVTDLSDGIERAARSISERESQVDAVRREVEAVHAVCARSKADLAYIADHRSDVLSLKNTVDALLPRIAVTDERLSSLDARSKVIDTVHSKAEAVATLLDDVNGAFDLLVEQREVVDQVADKIASLEALVQDAKAVSERAQRRPEATNWLARQVKNLRVEPRPIAVVPSQGQAEASDTSRVAIAG